MENFKEVFESQYTWIEGFMRNVRRFGQRNALIDPLSGRVWTYKAINQEVNRLCNAFIKAGVKKGDVIMLQMLNCPEFVFAYVACHKMQCVCCPVNFRLSPGEMAWNVDDSKPAIIICCESKCKEVNNALQNTKHKPSCVIGLISDSTDGIIAYNDFIKDASADEPVITTPYNIYDETVRLYTSGTTGRPKGVCITSINEVLSAHDIMIHFPMSSRDITMNTTPWFHRGGLHCAGPCPALYAGASMVIMGKFDALMALKYVYRYKITFIVGVPTVLEELADRQEQGGYDLSSLTGIVTMGSPLERAACIRYQKVLTPNIYNGYGTTETLWNTFLRPFDLPDNAGSAGRSCVDDDVRVVKIYEDRRAEPEDLANQDGVDVGEVIISSPAKSPFLYHDNPSETERKYYKNFIYTNDLATWDEDGYITIVGRKDDMIISSGENIYPAEVESVLNMYDKVKDCIVTSVPDKVRGQLVTAYVVPNDDSITAEELDEYCKQSPEIANFKRPRFYRFVRQIPFNATGKKLHVKIKETALQDWKNGLLEKI